MIHSPEGSQVRFKGLSRARGVDGLADFLGRTKPGSPEAAALHDAYLLLAIDYRKANGRQERRWVTRVPRLHASIQARLADPNDREYARAFREVGTILHNLTEGASRSTFGPLEYAHGVLVRGVINSDPPHFNLTGAYRDFMTSPVKRRPRT